MTFSSLKFIEKFLSLNDDLSDANMALSDADVRLDQNATLLNVGLWVYAKVPYNQAGPNRGVKRAIPE